MGVDAVGNIVRDLGLAHFIARLADEIESDYRRWPVFDKSARHAAHSSAGVIELMPISDGVHYAFKYVNGHPGNTHAGLSTVTAFGVLADVATGYPLLLAELTLATALRTAATSAMVGKRLARAGSRSMALIGNGAQSEFQAIAFMSLVGIDSLRVHDVDPLATRKLIGNLQPFVAAGRLRIECAASVSEAVRGADIVTTVTADKNLATILTGEMIEPGMHINAVGGDCPGKTELATEVLRRASVFVEYAEQTRIEGDIQQMPADFPVTEFWQVLRGEALGRRSPDEVTVFDSVGFAIEDFSVLCLLNRIAQAQGIGELIDLVPRLADPKNLFGESGSTAASLGADDLAISSPRLTEETPLAAAGRMQARPT
jgi:ornithine cyclodeaminase